MHQRSKAFLCGRFIDNYKSSSLDALFTQMYLPLLLDLNLTADEKVKATSLTKHQGKGDNVVNLVGKHKKVRKSGNEKVAESFFITQVALKEWFPFRPIVQCVKSC